MKASRSPSFLVNQMDLPRERKPVSAYELTLAFCLMTRKRHPELGELSVRAERTVKSLHTRLEREQRWRRQLQRELAALKKERNA